MTKPSSRMPFRRAPWVLLLGLVLAFAGGCQSAPNHEDWTRDEFAAPSESLLWQVVVEALQKEDFPVGTDLDPVTRTAVTGWRLELAPFRGNGFRERATVHLEPAGAGLFTTSVRVERELNMDIARPLDPSYAKWKAQGDDEVRARTVLQTIRSQLTVGRGD